MSANTQNMSFYISQDDLRDNLKGSSCFSKKHSYATKARAFELDSDKLPEVVIDDNDKLPCGQLKKDKHSCGQLKSEMLGNDFSEVVETFSRSTSSRRCADFLDIKSFSNRSRASSFHADHEENDYPSSHYRVNYRDQEYGLQMSNPYQASNETACSGAYSSYSDYKPVYHGGHYGMVLRFFCKKLYPVEVDAIVNIIEYTTQGEVSNRKLAHDNEGILLIGEIHTGMDMSRFQEMLVINARRLLPNSRENDLIQHSRLTMRTISGGSGRHNDFQYLESALKLVDANEKKSNHPPSHRSRQILVEKKSKTVANLLKDWLIDDKTYLRGGNVLFIQVKSTPALKQFPGLLEDIIKAKTVKILRATSPQSRKKQGALKGFLVYLELETKEQVDYVIENLFTEKYQTSGIKCKAAVFSKKKNKSKNSIKKVSRN